VAATILHWFTSDLRLRDNPALGAGGTGPVAGVFVLDPASLRRAADAPRRVAFLHACLGALDGTLRARGSRLIVREGDPAVELPRVAAALDARLLTHANNYEPAARRREARVAAALGRAGVAVVTTDAATVHPPGSLLTRAGTPYLVFGPFARAWAALPVRPAARLPRRWVAARDLAAAGGLHIPPAPGRDDLPPAGEAAARARLARFLRHGLVAYHERRDLPAVDGTSRLSHHLRFGTLSAAEAVRRVRAAVARAPVRRRGATAWLRELAWRDFFAHLLHAFPRVATEPFRELGIRWRRDARGLRRWREGATGYPFVDAGMRELQATGWMHNRARMVAASFLCRHLLIDWRAGERHFMALLLDGQLAQNDGNWQWVAGSGADAQPFHRIFSPVRQGERFDPQGAYVKRWVPELRRVPPARVHEPWMLTRAERRALCPGYPPPVVDPQVARGRALAAFEAGRRRR
jgi:deoxyribodipyrimidine photo-lyase